MKIEFKNDEMSYVLKMLMTVKAKSVQARAISKFIKLLSKKIDEFNLDVVQIAKDTCKLDEHGELMFDTDGNPIPKKGYTIDKIIHEQKLLDDEVSIIDLTEYEPFLENLYSGLEETSTEFVGADLNCYDLMMTKLEEVMN